MNWKQFGKAQLLSNEDMEENISAFMNNFGYPYRVIQIINQIKTTMESTEIQLDFFNSELSKYDLGLTINLKIGIQPLGRKE